MLEVTQARVTVACASIVASRLRPSDALRNTVQTYVVFMPITSDRAAENVKFVINQRPRRTDLFVAILAGPRYHIIEGIMIVADFNDVTSMIGSAILCLLPLAAVVWFLASYEITVKRKQR